jgi:hypothetical protein
MANASTVGFGLRAINTVGQTPATSGQAEYRIQTAPGVASNKGDPMSTQDAGNQGYQQDCAFTLTDDGGAGGAAFKNDADALLTGVFNGAFFIDASGKPTFSNNIVAGQTTSVNYNNGSNEIEAFIINNPFQQYEVKADAAVLQTSIGGALNFNIGNYTATDNKSWQSVATLNVASAADGTGGKNMFKLVAYGNDPENKDFTAAGGNVIVAIAGGAGLYA